MQAMLKGFFGSNASTTEEAAEQPKRDPNCILPRNIIARSIETSYEELSDSRKISDDYRKALEAATILLSSVEEQEVQGLSVDVAELSESRILTDDDGWFVSFQMSLKGVGKIEVNMVFWIEGGDLFFLDDALNKKENYRWKRKHAVDFYDSNAREALFERIGEKFARLKSSKARARCIKDIIDHKKAELQERGTPYTKKRVP